MNLFFAGNKKEMMIVRDLLNDLLSDPVLDQKDAKITMKNEYGRINVNRESRLYLNPESEEEP